MTAGELKRFNYDSACVKCGGINASAKYTVVERRMIPPDVKERREAYVKEIDAIQRVCCGCGFNWLEACLDAKKPDA